MIIENVGFFKRQEKSSRLLKKYSEIGKFSYIQIVLKSSTKDIVLEYYLDKHPHCVNNSPDIKVLMNVIETETFSVGFTLQ